MTIKRSCFAIIAEKIAKINAGNKQILTTYLDRVLTVHDDGFTDEINPCNHEEADAHATVHGHRRVSIQIVDTDVVGLP